MRKMVASGAKSLAKMVESMGAEVEACSDESDRSSPSTEIPNCKSKDAVISILAVWRGYEE
jgi:hypothetical protein